MNNKRSNQCVTGGQPGWLKLGLMLSLMVCSVTVYAQATSILYVAPTGGSVTVNAGSGSTTADRMLFTILDTPDGSDSLDGTGVVPITGGIGRQVINLGEIPGVRTLGFCTLEPGQASCVPNGLRRYVGAVDVSCGLTASPNTGPTPLNVAATATCQLNLGNGIELASADYRWQLPAGVMAPTQSPPGPAVASFTLAAPGSTTIAITPTFDFRIPIASATATRALSSPRVPATVTAFGANPPPSVTITNPNDGDIFTAPAVFDIQALVTPGAPGLAIAQVEFLVDGASIAIDTAAPYSTPWPARFGTGNYSLVARVTQLGQSIDSAPVRIQINAAVNITEVTLTEPSNNARIESPANFDVAANVGRGNPADVIAQVEFFANGVSIGIDAFEPYSTPWPSDQPPGFYTLVAIATQDGVRYQSPPVFVEILPVASEPPSVAIVSPADGAVLDAGTPFLIEASASDTDSSIAQVEFFLDGMLIGQSSSAPYTVAAPSGLAEGAYRLTARATDSDGISNASALISITLRDAPEQLLLVSAGDALRVQPGQTSVIVVRVSNGSGSVDAVDLAWAVQGGQNATVPTGATCASSDTPAAGIVRSSANGEARIEFLAGCAAGARTLQVSVVGQPAIQLQIELAGPNQSVDALAPQISADITVIGNNQPATLSVALTSVTGAPVASAQVNFELIPSSAGSISSSAISNSQGVATGTLMLNDTAMQASVQVCLDQRPDVCVLLPIRSLENAVLAPARELLAPIVRSVLEAPRAQMDVMQSRMRQLRTTSGHGFSNDVRLSIGELGLPLSGVDGNAEDAGDGDKSGSKFGVFVGGDISVSKRSGSDGRASGGYRAETRGLTVGVDYRVTPALVFGAALGTLRTDTDLPANGSQETTGVSGSLFGQWLPSESAYVTGIVHVGRNSYDIERFAGADQRLISDTDSRQQALQLEAGYSLASGPMRFTPFLRYEYIRAATDSITESGGSDALFIDELHLRNNTFSTGLNFDYAISSRSGVWIPGARIEYFGESLDQDEVLARLISGDIGLRATEIEDLDSRYGMAGVSLQWLTAIKGQPISMFFGFDSSFARDDFKTRRYALSVKVPL